MLAGAAAVDPQLGALPLLLALVLFLWTPPHFWSLAIANHDDYAAAGVPMLPVVVGDAARRAHRLRQHRGCWWRRRCCRCSSAPARSISPGALAGGALLHPQGLALARAPSRKTAMARSSPRWCS